MFPVKVEVAEPVTTSPPVVEVLVVNRFVAYRRVAVAFSEKYAEPMTSRLARVVVLDAPIKTWLEVVLSLMPELLKYAQSTPATPPEPASAPQVNFPVLALYSRVAASPEQSARPS